MTNDITNTLLQWRKVPHKSGAYYMAASTDGVTYTITRDDQQARHARWALREIVLGNLHTWHHATLASAKCGAQLWDDRRHAAVDVHIENHGSLVIVQPRTREAREWLQAHTDGTWWGGGLVVEPRYVEDLVEGLRDEGGFQVETS